MKLHRFKKTSKVVLGVLLDDVGGTYFTAENAKMMIPEGSYKVKVCDSPKFKRSLPLLSNNRVPASRGIRIHAGNNAFVDSAGCILVGNGCNLETNLLTNSRAALEQLVKNCGMDLEITSEV